MSESKVRAPFSYKTFSILSAFLIFTGCKSTQPPTPACGESCNEPTVATAPAPDNAAELEAKYWAKIKESRTHFTEADVEFMVGMIGHHAQALIMSDLAPKNDASPQIQILASRIINAQKDEIALMQRWLRLRDLEVPEVHIDGLNLMIHGGGDHHMDHSKMAGMLTQEQLVELSEAKGKEFDKLYLKYMIQHHSGAITMVDKLVNTDGAVQDEDSFRLSADIRVDQVTEINRMKLMLAELEGDPQSP